MPPLMTTPPVKVLAAPKARVLLPVPLTFFVIVCGRPVSLTAPFNVIVPPPLPFTAVKMALPASVIGLATAAVSLPPPFVASRRRPS